MNNEPNIKKGSFSVDDIHKVREYHHTLTKDMSTEERNKFYNDGANELKEKIKKYREEKLAM